MTLFYIYRQWPDGRWINEHGPFPLGTAIASVDEYRQISPDCDFVIAGVEPSPDFVGHGTLPYEIGNEGWYYPAWNKEQKGFA